MKNIRKIQKGSDRISLRYFLFILEARCVCHRVYIVIENENDPHVDKLCFSHACRDSFHPVQYQFLLKVRHVSRYKSFYFLYLFIFPSDNVLCACDALVPTCILNGGWKTPTGNEFC